MLDNVVNASAARPAVKAGAKLVEVDGLSCRNHFHFAILGVAYPAAQLKLTGLALHEPAEAYTLHTALDKEMNNHEVQPWPVLQMRASARKLRKAKLDAPDQTECRENGSCASLRIMRQPLLIW
jgi:hypothetical protein